MCVGGSVWRECVGGSVWVRVCGCVEGVCGRECVGVCGWECVGVWRECVGVVYKNYREVCSWDEVKKEGRE